MTALSSADTVQAYLDAEVQGAVDLDYCRDGFAAPDFLFERLEILFGSKTPEAYQRGYCRSIQEALAQGLKASLARTGV